MKTFQVTKVFRDGKGYPKEVKNVGIVTAYTFKQAMSRAAAKYNDGDWANISVSLKKS